MTRPRRTAPGALASSTGKPGDPRERRNAAALAALDVVFGQSFETDQAGKLAPRLADGLEIDADGRIALRVSSPLVVRSGALTLDYDEGSGLISQSPLRIKLDPESGLEFVKRGARRGHITVKLGERLARDTAGRIGVTPRTPEAAIEDVEDVDLDGILLLTNLLGPLQDKINEMLAAQRAILAALRAHDIIEEGA